MKLCNRILTVTILTFLVQYSHAESLQVNGMTIKLIRSVGDYPGTVFDNSVELWFANPIVWTKTLGCTSTSRVFVDAKHSHIISAAYMAFASGKKVNFFADDNLPIRNNSCEIGYLDVIN